MVRLRVGVHPKILNPESQRCCGSGRHPSQAPDLLPAAPTPHLPSPPPLARTQQSSHIPHSTHTPAAPPPPGRGTPPLQDLRLGMKVNVFGRPLYVYDCDDATRAWYRKHLGLAEEQLQPRKVGRGWCQLGWAWHAIIHNGRRDHLLGMACKAAAGWHRLSGSWVRGWAAIGCLREGKAGMPAGNG